MGLEVGCNLTAEVHQEKLIYEPKLNYFKEKYLLINIEVFGLLIGAQRIIPAFLNILGRRFA